MIATTTKKPPRKLKIPAEVRDQIADLLREGVLARKIARDLGVSRTFIRELAIERGIKSSYQRTRYTSRTELDDAYMPSPSQIKHDKWEIRNRGFTYLPTNHWYPPKDPTGEPEPEIIAGEEIPK